MIREFKGQSLLLFPSDYTVVDIETTGLSSSDCEIIEVSALKVRSEKIIDSFSSLAKPKNGIDSFITQLTGITEEMTQNAPDLINVLKNFYDFAQKDILLGHNVNFDVNFLYDNLLRCNGVVLDNDFVDTLRIARKGLPFLVNHKQVTIAQYFGISTTGSHRALRDCEICNQCYLNLKKLCKSLAFV